MLNIKKKFVTNEKNKKIAVQVDIKTFEKIEETLENFGLVELMQEASAEDSLNIDQAKSYYKKLEKS